MKTIILSDHTSTELERYQSARIAADAAATAQYDLNIEERLAARRRTAQAVKHAWKRGNVLSLLGQGIKLTAMSVAPGPAMPDPVPPSDGESRFEAGRDGEQEVLEALDQALDNSWTALCGYRARRTDGDIDIVLVGPTGVFAIEVKNHNVRANCDGDEWWNDRGYERVPIPQNGGRTPSAQLNNNTKVLRNYLAKTNSFKGMRTVIVFCNERSQLGKLSNLTVDHVTLLDEWRIANWFSDFPQPQSPFSEHTIVQSVQRSHGYWAKQREEEESVRSAQCPKRQRTVAGGRAIC